MSARELITEHLDLWTGAVTKKSSSGRGSNGKVELTGIKRLRELILELGSECKLLGSVNTDELATTELEHLIAKKLPTISPGHGDKTVYELWSVPSFSLKKPELVDCEDLGSSKKALPRDSVLLSKINPHLNRVWKVSPISEHPLASSPEWITLVPGPEWDRDFLVIALSSPRFNRELCATAQGMGSLTRANLKAVKQLKITRPPLKTQQAHAKKVDELMALCDRLEQQTSDQLEAHEIIVDTLLGTLTQSENSTELAGNWARLAAHFDTLFTTEQSIDKLKQTILQLAVMGLLEKPINPPEESIESLLQNLASERANGDNRSKQRKKKDSSETASKGLRHPIPANWSWIKFGETWINSFYGPRFAKHDYVLSGGIPTVRTTDMDAKGKIDLSNAPMVLVPEDKKELYLLAKNDILITRSGSIGVTAIYDLETPAIPSAYLIRLRLCPSINPHYVFIYLNSPHGQKSLGIHSTAVGVPNVNATKMASFDFPLPPKEEQSRIVQKVDELLTLCEQLKERLNEASETRCQLAEAVVEGALS